LLSNKQKFDDNGNSIIEKYCNEGKAILKYLKNRNKRILKEYGNISIINFYNDNQRNQPVFQHKCYWVTDYLNNSMVFSDNDVYNDPNIIYLIIDYKFHNNKYVISLYSTDDSKIDVSSIAKMMNGGGHYHAAGFTAYNVKMRLLDNENNPSIIEIYSK
jgi:nanoRNase/pAp phosphatase (c-di-AMP/oligoRNAs hydrolase)